MFMNYQQVNNGMDPKYLFPLNPNAKSFVPQVGTGYYNVQPGYMPQQPYFQNPNHGEGPAQMRKLFIGGLNHDTTDDQLKEYYSKWGHVVDCIVIRDPQSKHSRGFGFVTYQTIQQAENAMSERPHTINGKVVDPKRAIPREQMLPLTSDNPPHFLECLPLIGCKVVISGIHWDFHTVDGIRTHFDQFGAVEQVEILGNPRGVGFVVFEDKEGADNALAYLGEHVINGRKVDIKRDDSNTTTPSGSNSEKSSGFELPKHKKKEEHNTSNTAIKENSDFSDDCSTDNTVSTLNSL